MRTTRNPKITFPSRPPTVEEQYDDPYSPLYGKRPRTYGLEPGIDPTSDLGLFRNQPAFQAVKARFIEDLEASGTLEHQRGADSYIKSVEMMGPSFARFIDAASQMEDFNLTHIGSETDAMAAFFGRHVGKGPDDVLPDIVAVVYALTGPNPGSSESPPARVRRVGREFGERMKAAVLDANREKRETEEFLREKELEAQRVRQIQRRRFLEARGIIAPSTAIPPQVKKNRRSR